MMGRLSSRSLRGKILIAVICCAVVPLAAVGAWLTSTATRSGELLLRSQLDSTVDRAALAVHERWTHRESDVLLLANNEPIRAALRSSPASAEPPAYLRRAFETMPNVAGVVVRDAHGVTRWTLGETSQTPAASRGTNQNGSPPATGALIVHVPVRDETTDASLGEVLAFIRMDGLIPAATPSRTAGGAGFVAVHDRTGGAWLHPYGLQLSWLDGARFTWDGHPWLAVRRSLTTPAIDIIAAGALDPFVAPFTQTARLGASALAIVAMIVIVLTVFVTGRLTSSLSELADAADTVARGDLSAHIDVHSVDEVGRVARTFNSMTDSIRRMIRELSQREAVAAMGELAATLAHQVRSPATAIRLDVQRAHDKLPLESPERALLGRALEQLDRLERAVSGSLKVARSTGAEFRDIDVGDVLRRAVAGVERDRNGHRVRLDVSGIATVPLVTRGDEPSLEQLFTNVLTNAAQAARAGVMVSAVRSPDARITVTIRDDGPGMSAEVLARAGEPLFSTKPEGTGLGLAIAKRIAVAHGGELILASVPGEGSTASVELPQN
jgi:signal transduction histidine kinase